jgi:hypothetical protein
MEQLGNKRTKYRNKAEQPGPAIYHSQAVLDVLRRICEQDRATSFGGVHMSFDGETVVSESLRIMAAWDA